MFVDEMGDFLLPGAGWGEYGAAITIITINPCCALKHPAAWRPSEVSVKRAELGVFCGWGNGGEEGSEGGRCWSVSGMS